MPDNYDLFKETDEFISREKIQGQRRPHLYPSEASVKYTNSAGDLVTGGGCIRKAYYRITGEVKPTTSNARTEYIFAMGNAVEKILVNTWKEMGIWVANNVKFYIPDINVSGELDVILREPDGTLYVGEVKSFYGYNATKEIMGNRSQRPRPKLNNLLQTLLYTWHFRDEFPYSRLVYFARDSTDRRTFKVEVKEDEDGVFWPVVEGEVLKYFSVNDIIDRYKLLQKHVDDNIVPERDFEIRYSDEKIQRYGRLEIIGKTKFKKWQEGKLKKNEIPGDWQCSYCDYKHHCYSNKSES